MHFISENHMRTSSARIVRHFLRPARGSALMLIVVFSLLLFLSAHAGLTGLPLALIVVSWFFKYGYVLFDAASRGFDEPPTLDIQMVNPLNEQRPLAQVLILGAIYGLATFAELHISHSFAISVLCISMFLLPASAAVLGVEGNLLKALYPPALLNMVEGLGLLYGVMLGAIVAYAGLLAVALHWIRGLWIDIVLVMFALLSLFSLLGGIVYERRDQLGIEAWRSPEREAAKAHAERAEQDAHFVAQVYGIMRAGRHVEAWTALAGWLAERGNTLADYRWLSTRLVTWEDARYITRVTQEFLERLLAMKQNGEALQVAAARLLVDSTFRPRSASATLTLAQLAARGGGKPRVARSFTRDFAARFPNHPGTAAATALHATLGS